MSLGKGTEARGTPPPIALTMGEPAGIGGEITLMAWRALAGAPMDAATTFFVIDNPDRLFAVARLIAPDVRIAAIAKPADAHGVFASALPVLPIPVDTSVAPGRPARENAAAVIASIAQAVDLTRAGKAAAVVTNPIHKQTLYDGGFRFPGHTEFLAELAGGGTPVMMLTCPGLRVVPVTIHMPLARAAAELTAEAIIHAGQVTAAALREDFAIARPRLAVSGLNPHAGEGGALGREEIDIIAPAIAALREAGIDVAGPAAADSLFHPRARQDYDAALCMYHDQALIPVKTIDFEHGVNITLGLPFVRTSPDHGTAFDIAGTGRANPSSLLAALDTAQAMARARAAARRRSVA